MKTYEPENIKISIGKREMTGFHKEKRINPADKGEYFSQGLIGLLASKIEFHAKVNMSLPVNNKTKDYFTFLISAFVDDAITEGEIDGFVLYGIQLVPFHLSYGVFISGTEYFCSLKENEKGKLDLTVKEK